ncbi:AraC family transcriptional regulator [Paenibacillus cymbidii]|uniref:AraC family transcriptional regulator n=1 Tax=Paenibacillus cymbidii TaxID=1639034 RepID=UPI00108225D0|nr:AraC family transcriptional regulator [Paenibacillus cymbidii]
MSIFPEYQDVIAQFKVSSDRLPFYIFSYTARTIPLHYHDFAEFTYVVEGRGTQSVNGAKHRLQPGTVSFVLPQHLHDADNEDEAGIRKLGCMFDIHMLGDLPGNAELSDPLLTVGTALPSCCTLKSPHAERMHGIMTELYEECRNPGIVGHNSFIRAKLTEALLLFLRMAVKERPGSPVVGDESMARSRFRTIMSYIHIHYQKPLTLQQLAGQFCVSIPHITRSFKRHYGVSFLEYVHGLRMKNAAILLLSTNMTIADIALEVGFESFRTFSRVFRESHGRTPSEYRSEGGAATRV